MSDSLSISRNGRAVEVSLDEHGAFEGAELKKLGVVSYDQPLLSTATARSAITYIDGDAGILRYRGYPIEQLAERKHFLEVAYLLAHGELASEDDRQAFRRSVYDAAVDRERISALVGSFPAGSHPMAILIAGYAALGALHPETKDVKNAEMRKRFFPLVLAETLELGAQAIARHAGVTPRAPEGDTYARRFIHACGDAVDTSLGDEALDVFGKAPRRPFRPARGSRAERRHERDACDRLGRDRHVLVARRRGRGAVRPVARRRERGGSAHARLDRLARACPGYIERVKSHDVLLYGFGHRVYKNYDPRATVIKGVVDEVLATAGANPLLDIALELERIALEDDYFVSRKLYPNVDFYSGIAYRAIGFEPAAFTVLFGVARTVGWLCHYDELMSGDFKITRPAQVYIGAGERDLPD